MGIQSYTIDGDIGAVPRCQTCGSERVVKDAWACFNPETGLWEIETVFDHEFCQACEAETKLVWTQQDAPPCQRIRELNDRLRQYGLGQGSVLLTSGITGEGEAFTTAAVTAVRTFTTFSDDNDPWGEHDFGAVEVEGQKVFWKIDYYAPDMQSGSENPANEGQTHRVLTIMLVSEY